MWNADRLQVLHCLAKVAWVEGGIAFKLDPAHLDLGPFFYDERNAHRRGWNLADFRANRRELPSVFGQQCLQHYFRMFYFGGIELAFLGEPYLLLLISIQHIRL